MGLHFGQGASWPLPVVERAGREVGLRHPEAFLVLQSGVITLLIRSFVDHLFEFPAITLAMGMVVGLASYSRLGAK